MFTRREIERVIAIIRNQMQLRRFSAQSRMISAEARRENSRTDLLKDLCSAYVTARGLMSWDKEQFVAAARVVADQMEDIVKPTITVECKVVDNGEH